MGPSLLLFPGSLSALYRQSSSRSCFRCPMDAGIAISRLLFTSSFVSPVRAPKLSGAS